MMLFVVEYNKLVSCKPFANFQYRGKKTPRWEAEKTLKKTNKGTDYHFILIEVSSLFVLSQCCSSGPSMALVVPHDLPSAHIYIGRNSQHDCKSTRKKFTLRGQFYVLAKCNNNFECLIRELLLFAIFNSLPPERANWLSQSKSVRLKKIFPADY